MRTVLQIACVACTASSLMAADIDASSKPGKQAVTVESLVNNNPVPKLVDREPVFDRKYDWAEYSRVWGALRNVSKNAESLWPEFAKHLDDKRYCITIESDGGGVYNWTVGDACFEAAVDMISTAYFQHFDANTLVVYGRMHRPRIKDLGAWCSKRADTPLYEVQAQMCEWAVAELEKPEITDELNISDATRRQWIAKVKAEVVSLRKSKQAVECSWFRGEFYHSLSKNPAKHSDQIAPCRQFHTLVSVSASGLVALPNRGPGKPQARAR